jgi:anti-anti-sigma factor
MELPDGGPSFECRVVLVDDAARVLPIGEVDLDTVTAVAERLEGVRAAGAREVVLDLRATTFIDSSVMHLALAWHERARRERFEFALAGADGPARRAIEAAGLGPALGLVRAVG